MRRAPSRNRRPVPWQGLQYERRLPFAPQPLQDRHALSGLRSRNAAYPAIAARMSRNWVTGVSLLVLERAGGDAVGEPGVVALLPATLEPGLVAVLPAG